MPHAARRGARDPPVVPRRRRRHHRDEHVQRDRDLAGRVRARRARRRDQPRGRPARPRRGGSRRASRRATPVRRRRARTHEPHSLAVPGRVRSRVPRGHLRGTARRVPRCGQRADRRRSRHPAGRDHLRHAERQGGDRRDRGRVRHVRRPPPGDPVRDDHGSLRAHAQRADARGVLDLRRAHGARRRRPELRPRPGRAAPAPRRALAGRERPGQRAPERRVAERPRRLRHGRGRDGRTHRRMGCRRPGEPGRGLLREHARARPRDRRVGARTNPAHRPRARSASPGLRARGRRDLEGERVLQRRRAHERHGVGALRAARPRRRRRRGGGGRTGAGRVRRPDDRRQHGRRAARVERGDAPLPQPDRGRALRQPGADHDRLEQVRGHRGGTRVRPGQGDREQPEPEGRRGALRRARPARAEARRGDRGHGVRRAGPGGHRRAQGRDPDARLRAPGRRGRRASRATSSSTRAS